MASRLRGKSSTRNQPRGSGRSSPAGARSGSSGSSLLSQGDSGDGGGGGPGEAAAGASVFTHDGTSIATVSSSISLSSLTTSSASSCSGGGGDDDGGGNAVSQRHGGRPVSVAGRGAELSVSRASTDFAETSSSAFPAAARIGAGGGGDVLSPTRRRRGSSDDGSVSSLSLTTSSGDGLGNPIGGNSGASLPGGMRASDSDGFLQHGDVDDPSLRAGLLGGWVCARARARVCVFWPRNKGGRCPLVVRAHASARRCNRPTQTHNPSPPPPPPPWQYWECLDQGPSTWTTTSAGPVPVDQFR